MKKIIILYSSVDGHTKKICEFLSKHLSLNYEVEVLSIDRIRGNLLSNFDFLIVGASIRYGRHRRNVLYFVNKNHLYLTSENSAFFSVNIVARKPNKNSSENNPYVKKFFSKTLWNPSIIDVFAGKLNYPDYSFLNKVIIRFIMWVTKGPTDTTKVYTFTDWSKVYSFAKKIDLYLKK